MARMLSWAAGGCQGTLALFLVVSAVGTTGCVHSGARAGTGERDDEQTGVIRRVGRFGFGIVPDRDPGTRYAPDRLPKEFEVDGLRVIFSGRETKAAPGVRLWGTPFHLETIRRAPVPSPGAGLR